MIFTIAIDSNSNSLIDFCLTSKFWQKKKKNYSSRDIAEWGWLCNCVCRIVDRAIFDVLCFDQQLVWLSTYYVYIVFNQTVKLKFGIIRNSVFFWWHKNRICDFRAHISDSVSNSHYLMDELIQLCFIFIFVYFCFIARRSHFQCIFFFCIISEVNCQEDKEECTI